MGFLDKLFGRISKLSTEVPKATICYFFARGFQPHKDHLTLMFGNLMELHKTLKPEHIAGSFTEMRNEPAADSIEFINQTMEIVKKKHPRAYILDALLQDPDTGRDMSIMAVWDGDNAEKARKYF